MCRVAGPPLLLPQSAPTGTIRILGKKSGARRAESIIVLPESQDDIYGKCKEGGLR
jgi:hypothetical protein